MNIFLVGNAYPPISMGGESVHLYNLAIGLKRRGHRIYVAHPASSHSGKERVELFKPEDQIEVYRICLQPLAEACKGLSEKYDDIAFIFLGNGTADGWLRSYLSGIKTVHFVDWQAFAGVILYYHLADIAVVPSIIEPFGLVAIEAMACRTCVISSNADGLDEIITHNVNGVKIPLMIDKFGDRQISAEEIYSALKKAVCEPNWRRSLAQEGLIRAREFSLDRMAKEVEQVYQCLNKKK